MTDTSTGLLLLCCLTLTPLIIGVVLGVTFQRRYVALGWPWVIIPDFIRNILERYQQ